MEGSNDRTRRTTDRRRGLRQLARGEASRVDGNGERNVRSVAITTLPRTALMGSPHHLGDAAAVVFIPIAAMVIMTCLPTAKPAYVMPKSRRSIVVVARAVRVVRINARIDRIAEYRTFRRAVPVPPQDAPNDIGAPVYGADNRAFNRRDGWLRARRCGYGAHFRTHHRIPPPVHRPPLPRAA